MTPTNVASGQFGLIATVTLNGAAHAQPLITPNQQITAGAFQGSYAAVLYVATNTNWVYAIDASNGNILLSRNLGPYVTATPCAPNGGLIVGIIGTPTVDVNTQTLDLVSYTYVNGTPTYLLHALKLTDLTDTQYSPVTIAASHTLSDGTTFHFDARYQKQGAALLYADANIYVAFASWCDNMASSSRGWVLGFDHSTLAPLASNRLNDSLAPTSSNQYFLSSVWMSGAGLAGQINSATPIYFVTGNSKSGTYDGVKNVQESFVGVSSGLSSIIGIFTPSSQAQWDTVDEDFGSGGVTLLPAQSGAYPHLAVMAGKSGVLYLVNADNPGGYTPGGPDKVIDSHPIGGCFCTASYFVGSDGVTRVVSSGASGLIVWQVQTSPTTKLVQESAPATFPTAGTPGFFTSVSSNGSNDGTGVIWAASRANGAYPLMLYAYAARPVNGVLTQLFSAIGGYWNTAFSANLVPIVANGKVYVGSNGQLRIFGIKPAAKPAVAQAAQAFTAAVAAPQPAGVGYPSQVSGTVEAVNGGSLSLKTRTGSILAVDATAAVKAELAGVLYSGATVTVEGAYDKTELRASLIVRATGAPDEWPLDH